MSCDENVNFRLVKMTLPIKRVGADLCVRPPTVFIFLRYDMQVVPYADSRVPRKRVGADLCVRPPTVCVFLRYDTQVVPYALPEIFLGGVCIKV